MIKQQLEKVEQSAKTVKDFLEEITTRIDDVQGLIEEVDEARKERDREAYEESYAGLKQAIQRLSYVTELSTEELDDILVIVQ